VFDGLYEPGYLQRLREPASVGSHVVEEDWMGEQVETLADLLRPGLRAICVGINPSHVSVAVGHYHQGRLGQLFFRRLHEAGVIPAAPRGSEDDVAYEAGIGFTDIVKRPTARAAELRPEEFAYGRDLLRRKLTKARPGHLIFTYKKTAEVLYGRFRGHGFVAGIDGLAGTRVFVMPGPYERADRVATALQALADSFGRNPV
jgi:TDG/mug DNA glycosylase family protein